jgi:hypothetical protein
MRIFTLILCLCSMGIFSSFTWGFYAHKMINRLAVFTLPPEMTGFYKHHIEYITENSVNPDRRRYAVEGEAPRHFIDLDSYGDSALYKMPRYWKQAVEKHTEDTLMAHGIVPWHIYTMYHRLVNAMRIKDIQAILRLSADAGHYIADAHVPLHTTKNYNGQLTNQVGIHGFWESRLPELFAHNYDFFVGKAEYLPHVQQAAWGAVESAHLALDSVLSMERDLNARFSPDKKYSFEERGNTSVRVYSRAYSEAYHQMLDGMVERQMRRSIKMIGDFWYTCWVDAGQPDLTSLIGVVQTQEVLDAQRKEWEEWRQGNLKVREHEGN